MSDTRLYYSKASRPQEQFNEALRYLDEIHSIRNDDFDNTIEIMSQFIQQDMKLVVFGSNLIEGAGLALDETLRLADAIFKGQEIEIDAEKHILRSRWEVIQHAKALWYLTNAFVTEKKPLSEKVIKETHKILCTNVNHPEYDTPWEEYAGLYRNQVRQPGSREMGAEVHAGGTNFTPSKMVPKAMTRFVSELNRKIGDAEKRGLLDPFCLAAWACADFVVIHPFLDGNGRMCRILLNAMTMRYAGIVVPIGEHDEERSKYLDIKRRYSEDCDGEGEIAEMVLDRGTARLKALIDKMKNSLRLA
ncbi:fido domain-containing protein [Usnea florida]